MKYIIVMIALLSGALNGASENRNLGLGMWVWSQDAFSKTTARKELLDFCVEEGISHVDQHVIIMKQNTVRSIKNADALMTLVVAARKQGVTVNALRGSADMFQERNHEETLRDLQTIITFDKQLPSTAHLAGIKYDVEPYGTDEWKTGGKQRAKVMLDYLSFLQKARFLLNKEAPHLELCVDVPFWWDMKGFNVTFNGKEKLFVHHVQDLTDYISIMSYRPSSKLVLECVRQELAYAAQTGKTVCPALETGEIKGEESWISFWGKPTSVFRQTVGELQQALSGNRTTWCIMLHHYGSLVPYLKKTPNKPDADNGK